MNVQDVFTLETATEVNLLDAFLCDCQIRNFTERTIASYRSHIKYFLSLYPVSASTNDFKDFLVLLRDERGLSPSTVGNYFCSLSTFFDFLEWEKVVEKNVIPQFRKRYIRYYKEPRHEERQLISMEQMKDLINSASELQFKAMFLFFAKTGIRRQELIDLDLRDLYISKNYAVLKPHAKRSNRIVFFDDECAQVLDKWVKWRYNHGIKSNSLFVGAQGCRISKDLVYDVTTAHAQKLGFHDPAGRLNEKFTPHCFRHWFTTWMRRAGCSRPFLQELRGDIRKEAVDIYDHITQDELKEAYFKYMPKLEIN